MELFRHYLHLTRDFTARIDNLIPRLKNEIHAMEVFSNACIAPYEETHSMLTTLENICEHIDHHYDYFVSLCKIDESTISFHSFNPHSIGSHISKLRHIQDLTTDLIRTVTASCAIMQEFVAIANYWCTQKWLNGTSNLNPQNTIDIAQKLCSDLHSLYIQATNEVISALESLEAMDLDSIHF